MSTQRLGCRASTLWVVGAALLATVCGCSGDDRPAQTATDAGADLELGPACEANDHPRLDLLFVIDDTSAPEAVQFARGLPHLLEALGIGAGLDLHAAMVSTSMGAGAAEDVGGCLPGTHGSTDGAFQHRTYCGLHPGERFISANPGMTNFDGDLSTVLGCLADLGDGGCGFEQPFAAARRALERAADSADPVNGGFLRADAYLAVVIMTSEDDCSVPPDATLFDPHQMRVRDPLGGFNSYRCTEFGILCGGKAPPHQVSEVTPLADCRPAEEKGRLTTVASFVSFLRGLKPGHQGRLFLGALAGPPESFAIEPRTMMLSDGSTEVQPRLAHACTNGTGTLYSDPAVRVASATTLVPHSAFEPMCTADYSPQMGRLGAAINRMFGPCPDQ